VGAADLTGNGYAEIITGRDHRHIHAYNAAGQQLPNWPVRVYVDLTKTKDGVDLYIEFTRNAPSIADLDGDGTIEIVIAGKVRDPQQGHDVINSAVLVLQPDGQRYPGWEIAKLGGSPIAGSFVLSQAPALADLNGNGKLEIVVPLRDGTIRAYRSDGELLWQYDYAQGKRLFASEPVIGDVSGDGLLDIIFGTYSPDHSANGAARLHGLDATGRPLAGFPLALTQEGNKEKQGLRAAPTLADLDGDCDVEILAGSWGGNLYVWDLPAPYRPQLMPWPTSRYNNQRTGAPGPFVARPAAAVDHLTSNQANHSVYLPLIMLNGACG
jgi:hypothetical protein